jgi:hypothetical protein
MHNTYILELVLLIVKAMKLYPYWFGIMRKSIYYGETTVSSSRVESNVVSSIVFGRVYKILFRLYKIVQNNVHNTV